MAVQTRYRKVGLLGGGVLFLTCLLIVSLASTTASGVTPAAADDQYEPDDSIAQATTLPLNTLQTHNMEDHALSDYVNFTLVVTDSITIVLDGPVVTALGIANIWNSNGVSVGYNNSFSTYATLTLPLLPPDEYSMEIHGTGGEIVGYTVIVHAPAHLAQVPSYELLILFGAIGLAALFTRYITRSKKML